MELTRIEINNFRSIKDEKINFSDNCIILLGKNEAGKSNVIKAIASVFEKYIVSDKDKRKRIDNEKIKANEYYVCAIIKFSKNDINEIERKFKQKFSGFDNIVFSSNITLNDYISKVFYNLIIQIDIGKSDKPRFLYWSYKKNDIELENKTYLSENSIELEGGKEFNLLNEVFKLVKEYYLENPIKCHYWQYKEDFLLPNTVSITEFIESRSDFQALENIFMLCGREKIQEEFENAESEDGDYHNLLEQVSKKVTQTFQDIWKDFKGTSIQLTPDGDQIVIKITDKAKYNCEDRSDGFKKFISILLMLSTQSRAKKILENDLILIDEPDQSLYPTSAQYLRDELFNIAKKSKIVYATHSQYMIDTNNLNRHIVVEKKNGITTLNRENANAPYTTDELLKRAIGSSIFECLNTKNIIFEGFLDRKIFQKYCQFKKVEKDYKEFGKIYLAGISGVDAVVSILSSANKKFVVVADSDEASRNKRSEFKKNHPDFKDNWLAYADVISNVSTMEDFISPSLIEAELKKYDSGFIYDKSKNAIQNIEKAVNKDKDKKQDVKNSLVEVLKQDDVKEDYSSFLEKLKEKLESL